MQPTYWAQQCGVEEHLISVHYVPDNDVSFQGPCTLTLHGIEYDRVNNGGCEDGGPGSVASVCPLGYDYGDCPVRELWLPPPSPSPPPTPPREPLVFVASAAVQSNGALAGGGAVFGVVGALACCGVFVCAFCARRRRYDKVPRREGGGTGGLLDGLNLLSNLPMLP